MRRLSFTILLFLFVCGLRAQTIVSAGPLYHTLGDTVHLSVVMSSTLTTGVFSLRRGLRAMAHSLWTSTSPLHYDVEFVLPEFDEPGEYTLYYDNTSSYPTPFVLAPPTYPESMVCFGATRFATGLSPYFDTVNPLQDMVIDAVGNTYICGTFAGTLAIPPLQVNAVGGSDGYVAKLAPDGTALWIRALTGDNDEQLCGLALYQDTVLFVSGFVSFLQDQGPVLFGTDTIAHLNSNQLDGILLRLSTNGETEWVAQQVGRDDQEIRDVYASPTGKVYITGQLRFSTAADPVTLYDADRTDSLVMTTTAPDRGGLFVAAYDVEGTCLWARRELQVSLYPSYGKGMHIVPHQEGLLVIGEADGYMNFDSSYCGDNGPRVDVLKLDTTGEKLWCDRFGTFTLQNEGYSMAARPAVDDSGSVYLPYNGRLRRLNADGSLLYDITIPGSVGQEDRMHYSTLALSNDRVLLALGERVFDYSHSGQEPVLKTIDPQGTVHSALWPIASGYQGVGYPQCLAWDAASGSVVFGGILQRPAAFGPDDLAPFSSMTVFIARVDDDITTRIPMLDEDASFTVFPNPAQESILIRSRIDRDLVIMDAMGRRVLRFVYRIGAPAQVSLNGLTDGLYILADTRTGDARSFVVLR